MERAYQVFGDVHFSPETITDTRVKKRKRYRYEELKTPYEKLKLTPNASFYLNLGMTLAQLNV